MICRHCHKNKVVRPRGLCCRCFYTPGVKEQYPITSKFGRYAMRQEPTEEELEATIAEQMKCLPKWWDKENPEE